MPNSGNFPISSPITAPSGWLLLLEGRALLELGAYYAARRLLARMAPAGEHYPVLVLPGFGTSDTVTAPLREFLTGLGYAAYGWEQGMNFGMNPKVRAKLLAQVAYLRQTYGQKVSLIGHSLGGVFARELAKKVPQDIRQVITLGSPITGPANANNIDRVYHFFNPKKPEHVDLHAQQRRRAPPPVPTSAIHSRNDGIVAWQCTLEQPSPWTENIEIHGSHSGLCCNVLALYVVADRLSQPEANWQPFARTPPKQWIFPDPTR